MREAKRIDSARIADLREARDVLGEIEQTANRLAELGDRERPKAEAFIKTARDAAREVREPRQPPPIVGPDGRAIPTNPGFYPPPKPPPGPPRPTISTGGGSGAGTGTLPPERRLTSVQDRPGGGKFVEPESWLRKHCERTTFRIPRPGNPRAREENDFIEIGGYDCSKELHAEAYFYDPIEPLLSSGSGAGGASTRGAPPPRVGNFTTNPDPNSGHSWIASPGGSTTTVMPPQAPTPGDRLVTETLRTGFRELVRELRETTDLGLAIRRNGGL